MDSTIDTLNHVTANFSSVSGFDKALALVQYTSKMLLLVKAKDLITENKLPNLKGLTNLARIISDTRTLFRFRGSLPLLATALQSTFSKKAATEIPLTKKLQLYSMLLYYPLEHAYWLGSHNIIPLSPAKIMSAAKWSCRAWLVYNLLELYNIVIKYQEVVKRERLEEFELKSDAKKEKFELTVHTFSMICYTYMSIHYSFDNSPLSPVLCDVAGFAAALAAYIS